MSSAGTHECTRTSRGPVIFFVGLFVLLAIVSWFWARSVRENYEPPASSDEVERIPDPFAH